jgi:PPOX class probable F420-dependent enzyme
LAGACEARADVSPTDEQLAFVAARRTATLATLTRSGESRLVPVCFVLTAGGDVEPTAWIPLDEKPKTVADPRRLARVRDIEADPRVVLLADRWSEDWGRLGWVRAHGHATLVEPAVDPATHAAVVAALRAKYPQYRAHRLEVAPLIRIALAEARSWGDLSLDEPPRPADVAR